MGPVKNKMGYFYSYALQPSRSIGYIYFTRKGWKLFEYFKTFLNTGVQRNLGGKRVTRNFLTIFSILHQTAVSRIPLGQNHAKTDNTYTHDPYMCINLMSRLTKCVFSYPKTVAVRNCQSCSLAKAMNLGAMQQVCVPVGGCAAHFHHKLL